jgi:hypothetical protein
MKRSDSLPLIGPGLIAAAGKFIKAISERHEKSSLKIIFISK